MCVCVLAASACSDDDTTPVEEDPGAHACEHVNEAGTAVTAGDSRATAAEIAIAEEPYTVTLVSGAPSFVKIASGADALLFTKATGVVTAMYRDQETTSLLAAAEPNDACPSEIPEHFDLELEMAGTYYVELAPAATPSVWLALTAASGHAH
jgi:hypothetical protein